MSEGWINIDVVIESGVYNTAAAVAALAQTRGELIDKQILNKILNANDCETIFNLSNIERLSFCLCVCDIFCNILLKMILTFL